jgi:hypothetical protein
MGESNILATATDARQPHPTYAGVVYRDVTTIRDVTPAENRATTGPDEENRARDL